MVAPVSDILQMRHKIQQGIVQVGQKLSAQLLLGSGDIYKGTGMLVASSPNVSTTTGAVPVRFQFDNPDHIILPGMFIRGTLQPGTQKAFLVPQRAGSHGADGKYSNVALGNLFSDKMEKQLERLDGVGNVTLFGTEYAMRIWLDPKKLYTYALTPSDIADAITNQNTNVTVGSLGATPNVKGQQIKILLKTRSQLTSVDDFKKIILKTNDDGSSVFLSDVARVELGNDSYDVTSVYNGNNAAGFGVNLSTDANAVETSTRVHNTITALSKSLPQGIDIVYSYDTTPFIEASITKIFHTLFEAIALVFIVILIFLQSWRATLIPTLVVSIVLLGTFGILEATGLSLNTLTMFALVLAIGLLVDDAIVVVENVERIMAEEKLSAMVLSLFVALILTPAMCVSLLKPSHGRQKIWPSREFNNGFERFNLRYSGTVGRFLKRPFRMLAAVAIIAVGCSFIYDRLPSSFVPVEDQSILMTMISLPENATQVQTIKTVTAIKDYLLNDQSKYVKGVFSPIGHGFDNDGQNVALAFIKLKDLADRPDMSASQFVNIVNKHFSSGRYGQVLFLQPPSIQGLGTTNGFQLYLIDRGNNGIEELQKQGRKLAIEAQKSGLVTAVRGFEDNSSTQLTMEIDSQKAQSVGLTLEDINNNLSIIFGGEYVNEFILDGSLRNVRVKGDQEYRMQASDINDWYMRNSNDEMVPMASFSKQVWGKAFTTIYHHNGDTAIQLQGSAAPRATSGEAMAEMARLVDQLGSGYSYAWTGLSYQEQIAGNQETILYLLSAVIVFLALAALYESWTVPLSVMLAVPISLLGALLATWIFDQSNDVYFKVGMLTIIGLAARNAILIVEFAESMRKEGHDLIEAIITASKMRLRPILMTTFAFGVLPLAIANGTGANAQNSIGTGMLGGIVFSALFGIIMVPVLYLAVLNGVKLVKNIGKKETL